MIPTTLILPISKACAIPNETANNTKPTASSMATTNIRSLVRGPSALYCLITINVAAGAVADAMAPSVIAAGSEIKFGFIKCTAIRANTFLSPAKSRLL